MEVSARSRLRVRIQNIAFVVLFLGVMGLLAWLSTQYTYQADWTAGHRNTLTQASVRVLKRIAGPVTITAYARENPQLRRRIRNLVDRYRRAKSDIRLDFINPDTVPAQVRQLGITVDGELVIQYRGRSQQLTQLSEQALTNALLRVASGTKRRAVFLTGHGERAPLGRANFDLGDFGRELERKGIAVRTLNLADVPNIPAGTTVLVIASPRVNLLPGETAEIVDYVKKGGNLLWFHDPGPLHGLDPLAKALHIRLLPGTIVDPAAVRLFRAPFALVTRYPPTPVTQGMNLLTLFPEAAAITIDGNHDDWQGGAFLQSSAASWDTTRPLKGTISFVAGKDRRGPQDIGVYLTRAIPSKDVGKRKSAPGSSARPRSQRIAVIGDGDFLSNTYLGNAGNLNLGLKIFQWITHNDRFVDVPARTAPDRTLTLSASEEGIMGFGLLFGLPVLLLGSGIVVWYRRRRR
ncbi:ABC-type uncharacterized transport system [bacterium BMS3Bbin12]|nr:ABC-type uncharacterized transport system [bacterium BMS3Abin12]GBE46915.1 ABC-type uncharacterized transport system [bacterium BMS3Bbin12]GBE50616.1 ABC-type uncharacterized transport system [bacterium BMS3Bbin13]